MQITFDPLNLTYMDQNLKNYTSNTTMSRRIYTNNITSSTSSSSPPLPNFQLQEPNNKNTSKTMEEVWKDINLTSLHGHPHGGGDQVLDLSVSNLSSSSSRLLHHHHQNPNVIIQDFLATPLCNKNPPALTSGNTCKYGGSRSYAEPPPAPPATVLSLYSGPPEFDFFDLDHAPDRHNHPHLLRPMSPHLDSHPSSNGSPFVGPFEGLDSASGLMPCFGRKRVQESDSSSGDRRHKRMIKNRESAARSRARKQAYTNELELEVAHLMEENARLRRQQEQLRVAVASQLPKKSGPSRTSTAPF